ncbi:MAG: T9SS type A sorting domain-containing protein [Calditrichaeota bacterium]|nr:T9SS type A sorting domain-containing protein [Calditrichota bacterium]MCB9369528.1 T9SS type A sorting domain-containing protein [Calditrichota bacterium]
MPTLWIALLCLPLFTFAQDSINITRVGWNGTVCSPENVTVLDNYAFVCAQDCGIELFTIHDPSSPILSNARFDSSSGSMELVVRDGIAYLATWFRGLVIYEVHNPESPTLLSTFHGPDGDAQFIYASGLDVSGDYAYVAFQDSGLWIIDISNPSSPEFVSSFDTPGSAWDVVVENNIAYVSDTEGGMRIIDVSNPAEPEEIGSFDTPGQTRDIHVEEDMAYLADGGGLRIVGISDGEHPTEVSFLALPGMNVSVDFKDGYAFIGGQGVRVVELFDPSNPVEVGYYVGNTVGWPIGVTVYGNYVIASIWGDTDFANFTILDVSHFLPIMGFEPLVLTFSLHPIYPNPFNNTANIVFDLPHEVTGKLVVYDVLGRVANTLFDGRLSAGTYQMAFDGNNLSSGIYFVKLETPDYNSVQKAVLLK